MTPWQVAKWAVYEREDAGFLVRLLVLGLAAANRVSPKEILREMLEEMDADLMDPKVRDDMEGAILELRAVGPN